MALEDRMDLKQFIAEFRELMTEVTDGRPPSLLRPAQQEELRQAFLRLSNVFDQVSNELNYDTIESPQPGRLSLGEADLTGPNRDLKISGFRRAVQSFRGGVSRGTLGRVFRWANTILGSLATVIPPAEALKELKEYAHNLILDEEQ